MFLGLVWASGGCLFSIEPPEPNNPASASDAGATIADGACEAIVSRSEPTCAADLTSDPAHCGACEHACRSGQCVDGICAPRVTAVLRDAHHVAAWDAERIVYSSQRDGGPANVQGMVVRALVDGSAESVFFENPNSTRVPKRLVVYDAGITYAATSGLYRVGSELADASAESVAIDPALSSDLTYSAFDVSDAGTFWSCTNGSVRGILPGSENPVDVVFGEPVGPVRVDGRELYWIGRSVTGARLRHITIRHPDAHPAEIASDFVDPIDMALTADFVVVADRGDRAIVRVGRSGCTDRATIADDQQRLEQVVTHAGFVYWVTTDDRDGPVDGSIAQSIWRLHLRGGTPLRLLRRSGASLRDLVFLAEGLAVLDASTGELLLVDP